MKKLFLILPFFFFISPVFAGDSFSDIADSEYKIALEYAKTNDIVQGYSDGTFKPHQPVNRAEFSKIATKTLLGQDPLEHAGQCFTDVNSDHWFYPYVCYMQRMNIVNGYSDGSYRPADNINVVEAVKILVHTFKIPTTGFEGGEWYEPYLKTLGAKNVLPLSFSSLEHKVTRAEMLEMIWRIKENKTDQPSLSAQELMHPTCLRFSESKISGVDMAEVRRVWLSWINTARADQGLSPYTYNPQLNRTAFLWSEFSASRNQGSHKRPGQTAYYDYNIIMRWFRDLGLTFANLHSVTYSENIGWYPYFCNQENCTQAMIDTLRYTFDGYMAEKNKASRPHYDSLMNSYFHEIGFGIAISNTGVVYNTTHYATSITSSPLPICQ